MPCYDPRGTESRNEFSCNCSENGRKLREVKKILNETTALLCKFTDNLKLEEIEDLELRKWVKEHREFDAARKEYGV